MDNDFTPSFQVIRSIFSPRGLLWLGHRIQIYYEVRIWSKFPANRELSHQQAVKLSPWCVRCTFLTTTRAAEMHSSWWSPVASDQTLPCNYCHLLIRSYWAVTRLLLTSGQNIILPWCCYDPSEQTSIWIIETLSAMSRTLSSNTFQDDSQSFTSFGPGNYYVFFSNK